MKLPDRPFQANGLNQMREQFKAGKKRILLFMATGSGKGHVFSRLCDNLNNNRRKVLLVMRRRELIFQSSERLTKFGVWNSVIMGNEKGFNSKCPVQVCSIDTVGHKISKEGFAFLKQFDAIIIDECHDCTSPKYKRFFWTLEGNNYTEFTEEKFNEELPKFKKLYIGLTATPFPIGKRVHDFWESCVKPIEVHELRDKKYLVDADIFAPSTIDTENVKLKSTGDFKDKELEAEALKPKIIGDIVGNYKKNGKSKPAIFFGVTKEHSIIMAQAFNDAGIPAKHCDSDSKQDERDKAINDLKTGKIKVLCNVNIWSTGLDVPQVEIGIMGRPTMSEVLYIQQIGRFLRPYIKCVCGNEYGGSDTCFKCGSKEYVYKKTKAIIYDHANNTARHGFPFDIRDAVLSQDDLENKKKSSRKGEQITKECPECFGVNPAGVKECSLCGFVFEIKKKELEHEDGELEQLKQKTAEEIMMEYEMKRIKKMSTEFKSLQFLAKKFKWKSPETQIAMRLKRKFGLEVFEHIVFPDNVLFELGYL